MINFEQYHKQNPDIWYAFKEIAMEAKMKGFKTYSANGIFEVIRWHQGTRDGNDGFKVNNNYRADYARKLMNEHPEFKGFFRIKQLTAPRNI